MYPFTAVVFINFILKVLSRSTAHGPVFLGAHSPVAPAFRGTCDRVHGGETPQPLDDKYDKLSCLENGFSSLKRYQHSIPLGDGHTFMPVYSSERLTDRSDHITQAIIWVHGVRENANKFFCDAMLHTSDAQVGDRTLSIVPWFSGFYVTGKQWAPHSAFTEQMESACWPGHAWMGGSEADNAEITAFGVLDKIAVHLQMTDTLPKLSRIVFVGYSAGCQMVSRWSFFSNALLPGFGRAKTTAIMSSCGTYLYLDDQRPAKQCSALHDTGAAHRCHTFHNNTGRPCRSYDRYRLSLNLEDSIYVHGNYLRAFGEYPIMVENALDRYPSKDIRFMVGSSDACSCNVRGFRNADSCYPERNLTCAPNRHGGSQGGNECCDSGQDNVFSVACGSRLQGSNRLQRSLNYVSYLRHFYKQRGVAYDPPLRVVDGGHNSSQCFASGEFREWAFEEAGDAQATEGAEAP